MRPDKKTYYFDIAKVIASRSTCLKKCYGAVIVKDDKIVSTGYNGSPAGQPNCCDCGACYADTHSNPKDPYSARHGMQYGNCVAVHAEQNALIRGNFEEFKGATLYLAGYNPQTSEWIQAIPCNICHQMLQNAGIKEIITQDITIEL